MEVFEADVAGRDERVPPGQDWTIRVRFRPVQFAVALAHEPERVLVVAEPDVQAVFFDAAVTASAARTLAAQAPASLIHRDALVARFPPRFAQAPRRGQTCHPTAEDGD